MCHKKLKRKVTINMSKKQVVLCGGGNAVHVLTAYVGALEDCDVSALEYFS